MKKFRVNDLVIDNKGDIYSIIFLSNYFYQARNLKDEIIMFMEEELDFYCKPLMPEYLKEL